MDEKKAPKPPYVPFGTFKNFVDGFADEGLPAVIDRTLMPSLSGTVQSMLTTALKSMSFIKENGIPTARFEDYVGGDSEVRARAIRGGLEDCYSEVFAEGTDLTRMTPGQFDKVLRERYSLTSSTLDKSASFFLAAAADCGLAISTHLQKRKPTAKRQRRAKSDVVMDERNSLNVGGDPDSGTERSSGGRSVQGGENPQKPLQYQLIDLMAEPDFDDEHRQAVWALVQYLAERRT